jgi:hypothetical protein
MNEQQASRTLLKSPPELWAECSDTQSLARHLDTTFGEIRITKLEPESTVAWEGERASGTVKLEPSGWGTRVTLTCSRVGVDARQRNKKRAFPAPQPDPGPLAAALEQDLAAQAASSAPEPKIEARRGTLFTRVMRLLGPQRRQNEALPSPPASHSPPEPASANASASEPRSAPEPPAPEPLTPEALTRDAAENGETPDPLEAALDSLGQAHHRPFSRA